MSLEPLRALLRRYAEANPSEAAVARRILDLVEAHPDCLLRTCAVGHVTASALILSPDRKRALLTHHRKLDRWLQLGGHVDGEVEVHRAALREAQEESGMERFRFLPADATPVDLDVHPIPAHGDEPAHFHHDVRFLLVAEPGQVERVSEESKELRWFALEEIARDFGEESLRRLASKALALAGSRS